MSIFSIYRLQEFSKSHFEEVYKYRSNLGKEWVGPPSYFRADKALYLPNFVGRTLSSKKKSGTTDILKGNVSIVRIYTSVSGEAQASSYFKNREQATGDEPKEDGYQIVDINFPENKVKDFLVRMFEGNLRKSFGKNRHGRYFIATDGVSVDLKKCIGLSNKYTGYIYLVDRDCKIRWAACGNALDPEKEWMWKSLKGLVNERKKGSM